MVFQDCFVVTLQVKFHRVIDGNSTDITMIGKFVSKTVDALQWKIHRVNGGKVVNKSGERW